MHKDVSRDSPQGAVLLRLFTSSAFVWKSKTSPVGNVGLLRLICGILGIFFRTGLLRLFSLLRKSVIISTDYVMNSDVGIVFVSVP
jgi:hypothetical protein